MDETNKKTEEFEAPDSFEAQLAELIKQSGGTVPPKRNTPPETDAKQSTEASPKVKTEAEIDAEIDALINGMSDNSDDVVPPPAADPVTTKTEEEIDAEIDALINGIVGEETPSFSEEKSLRDMEAEIAELEKSISEAEIAALEQQLQAQAEEQENERKQAAESYRLDYELEEMLNSLKDEENTDSGNEHISEMEKMQARLASLEFMMNQKADARPIETTKEEKPNEIPKDDIEIVPTPSETAVESDEKREKDKDDAVTENEQLRARIASLEYMLAQKKDREDTKQSVPQPEPTQNGGDMNSMFKQWFDLEMAAKMKNLITEDEQKKAEPKTEEQFTASDFIKLSDNVYYNVKEKKTYIMRELTAKPKTLPAPKRTKPIKKKTPARKKPVRDRRRNAHTRATDPRRRKRRPAPRRPR